MVLDSIVGSTFEELGDVGPLVCLVAVLEVKDPFFFARPRYVPFDVWVQVVVPSLPALFADSSGKMTSNRSPLLRTINIDKV